MQRTNSTIKVKCKCGDPSCDKWPTPSCYGYYYAHLPEKLKEKAGTRRKVQIKNKNKRAALSRKLHMAQKQADRETEGTSAWKIELFFVSAAFELAKHPYCQECNTWIPPHLYRSATAHILAKRKEYGFPSVAAHPKNRLFLCGINGCHDKTHRWDTFSKMKVWPLAVEAFKEIYPHIDNSELKNLPTVLLETLKQ